MSVYVLPTEVLQYIFSFTTWKDQKSISLVCRRWAGAIEPLLLARTCLKVSHYEVRRLYRVGFDDFIINYNVALPNISQLRLIDKDLLMNSNRGYTCLRVQWNDERTETKQNVKALQEILDVCQERFPVQRLYLRGPLCDTLTNLFTKHQKWLENLTELNFEEYSTMKSCEWTLGKATIELSLPKLKLLTWLEFSGYQTCENPFFDMTWDQSFHHYNDYKLNVTLHVPELYRLKMRVNKKCSKNSLGLSVTDAKNCYLFHPNLNLKSCAKLNHIDVSELGCLNQNLANLSESLLQHLKTLTLFKCETQAIRMICRKCSNLEELIVDTPQGGYLPFRISVALSHSLKKLTLRTFAKPFRKEKAVFTELHYLSMRNLSNALRGTLNTSVGLVAPKLTTLETARSDYTQMRIDHIDQIRTMIVYFESMQNIFWIHLLPPPNITQLILYQREAPMEDHDRTMIQDYINLHSNLRRLSLYGSRRYGRIELSLRNLPNLEYLCANYFAFRLTDFHELTKLKTLTLSYCSIKTNLDDAAVQLSVLEYMRVEKTTFVDFFGRKVHAWDHFPIYGNECLPPVLYNRHEGSFSTLGVF